MRHSARPTPFARCLPVPMTTRQRPVQDGSSFRGPVQGRAIASRWATRSGAPFLRRLSLFAARSRTRPVPSTLQLRPGPFGLSCLRLGAFHRTTCLPLTSMPGPDPAGETAIAPPPGAPAPGDDRPSPGGPERILGAVHRDHRSARVRAGRADAQGHGGAATAERDRAAPLGWGGSPWRRLSVSSTAATRRVIAWIVLRLGAVLLANFLVGGRGPGLVEVAAVRRCARTWGRAERQVTPVSCMQVAPGKQALSPWWIAIMGAVIGGFLALPGMAGHAAGGRKRYFCVLSRLAGGQRADARASPGARLRPAAWWPGLVLHLSRQHRRARTVRRQPGIRGPARRRLLGRPGLGL